MAVGRAEILVVADATEFDRQMRRVLDSSRRGFGGIKRDAADADKSLGAIRKTMNGLGSLVGLFGRITAAGLGIGAVSGALGATAASAVQLVAALAPAVGIIAAAPAAIGLLAGAAAVLTVALSGVGDAFAAAVSGDGAEFNEAIAGLPPNVQAAATALREITPQFTALRESVQGAFFEGFDATLLAIAATLAGPLTEGMTAAAAGLAGITTRIGEAVTSGAGVAFIQTTFAALANVLANLQEPIGLLVEAFLSLGSSINIAFGGAEAGAALGALIEQFAAFINTAADSGAAVGWVEGAITVFSQLGAIVGSVVGIFGTIGEVASATGGNILGAFGAALESVNAFLSSAEGISTLTSIFTTLNAVGQAFGTIIAGLLPIIVPLIGTLVSGLMPVLESLTPLLLQIAAAAAPIFTQILAAVMPLIPPLVQLAQQILPLVATLFSAIVAAVAPLLEVLVNLLVTVLEPLLPALMPLIELFGELAGMLAAVLVPIFELLGEILLWVVNEIVVPFLIPIIEKLVEWLGTTLVDAVSVLGTVFEFVIDAIVTAATWLGDQWGDQITVMRAGWQLLQDRLRAGYNFIKSNVIDPVKNAFSGVRDLLSGVVDAMTGKWDSAISKFKSGATKIKDAVGDMFGPLWTGFKSAINSVINGWNGLSFTMPSVDLGPLGSTPSFTVSTPNIPTLQTSGFSFGTGLVNLHPNEAIVNAKDRRGLGMLATALEMAGANTGGIVVERGAIVIEFHGATPDPAQARRIGQAAGDGLMRTLATRGAQLAVRRF
jgi:phage-related protein